MIETMKIDTKKFFENAVSNTIISEERKVLLLSIADAIIHELTKHTILNINFICTHNSRRSQMGQVWCFFASEYFNIKNIFSFSGGTEATSFHRNTVKTLQKVGFDFNIIDFSHQNPRYLISFKDCKKSILGFSKTFDDATNKHPYIAIITCDEASKNCPFIPDASHLFNLPFEDPKIADNTDLQHDKYLETCKQIAAEIFIIFQEVKNKLK